jgi:hypothetical protein
MNCSGSDDRLRPLESIRYAPAIVTVRYCSVDLLAKYARLVVVAWNGVETHLASAAGNASPLLSKYVTTFVRRLEAAKPSIQLELPHIWRHAMTDRQSSAVDVSDKGSTGLVGQE